MKIGILFDLDGTLLDTLDDLADATNHVLGEMGYPQRTREEVRRFVGNGVGRLLERAVPENGDARKALELFQPYYAANCQVKTQPYAGILEALDSLKEKYPLAIVSNKPDHAVKKLCGQYFPGIFARGESSDCPRKPAPDMVHKAMETIGVEHCVYVGDSEVDVLTAQNAGVPCLSVLWGFRDRETMEQVGGKYFCNRPEELEAVLESIIAEEF